MPKIPEFHPQTSLTLQAPRTLVDTNSFGKEHLAAARTWKELGDLGHDLAGVGYEISKQIYRAQQVNDLSDMISSSTGQLLQLRDSVKSNPDPDTWLPAFKEGADKIKDEILQQNEDPVVQAHFNLNWARGFPKIYVGLTHDARKQKVAKFAGNVQANFDKGVDHFIQAGNDLERAKIEADTFSMLDGGVAAGYLLPAKAQQLKDNFEHAVMIGAVNREVLANPVAAFDKLSDPEHNYPGMDAQTALALRGRAQAEMHRVQNNNYAQYMLQIEKATGDNPDPGAALPSEGEILNQVNARGLSAAGGQNILALLRGNKGNQENKTDPESYKEAVTRLTDPDHPLTREEFLKNVKTGEWKFDAKTYGGFLLKIGSREGQLEKSLDSAFKARIGFWKTQFGGDARDENFMTALAQAQMAKDAGKLGDTQEEIYKKLDAIFKPHADQYAKENFLGQPGPSQQSKPGIISRTWTWATQVGHAGAQPGPETVTKDGKTYRVLTINGRKMVDPNPLP